MEYDSEYWRHAALAAQEEAARCARIALEYIVNDNGQRTRVLARAWQYQSASASGVARARMELASPIPIGTDAWFPGNYGFNCSGKVVWQGPGPDPKATKGAA